VYKNFKKIRTAMVFLFSFLRSFGSSKGDYSRWDITVLSHSAGAVLGAYTLCPLQGIRAFSFLPLEKEFTGAFFWSGI
jgi:hypothetical protein